MELKLSNKARKELRKVLAKDISPDRAAQFPEEDLDDLGHTLLRLTAIALKRKAKNPGNQRAEVSAKARTFGKQPWKI